MKNFTNTYLTAADYFDKTIDAQHVTADDLEQCWNVLTLAISDLQDAMEPLSEYDDEYCDLWDAVEDLSQCLSEISHRQMQLA